MTPPLGAERVVRALLGTYELTPVLALKTFAVFLVSSLGLLTDRLELGLSFSAIKALVKTDCCV
jgi:hypothetical protein